VDSSDARRHLLALCRVKGAKWELLAREAQRPGGLDRLLAAEVTEANKAGVATAEALREALPTLDERLHAVDEECGRAFNAGARLLTVLDDEYPTNLRLIYNLPPFIFVLGELHSEDERSVAVVGTRKPTAEGVDCARDMARGLALDGVTVVSGMARGIDTAAHTAALEAGGRTVAVMGTGILRRYPAENADLANRILEHGALVSQFWPSAAPNSYNFPRRNVVMSGISQGTVVIEASSTSGAKMQARFAVEHGKLVFLAPLAASQDWAERYLRTKPRVFSVATVGDVTSRLEPSPKLHALYEQRAQLAFDLA
jgi:DNA processing protein